MTEWWYNTTFHSAIGMCPYKALYGKAPPSINYLVPATKVESVDTFISDRIEVQRLLKENLSKAQERMTWYVNKKRSDREFCVGDEVFLKIQPYRKSTIHRRNNQKLSSKYYGPYKVLQRIGKVAYRLELPPAQKYIIHFMFLSLRRRLESRRWFRLLYRNGKRTRLIINLNWCWNGCW